MREVSRSVHVSLAHRYWNFVWDREQNVSVYGAQASPEGVGANMRLVLSCDEEPDLQPGVDRLKRLVDHRALFEDFAEFHRAPSTLERVAEYLAGRHGAASFRALTVHEDQRLGCRVDREGRLRLRERVFNLDLEFAGQVDAASGVSLPRGHAARTVRDLAPNFADDRGEAKGPWAERLFADLKARLGSLAALTVHLNPREAVRVTDSEEGEDHA